MASGLPTGFSVYKVATALNADAYALLEVVDTIRLRSLVAAMPGYAYRVSGFGSATDDSLDTDYP